MRIATLMLSAVLALGMGLSGNALAHSSADHGHGHPGYGGAVYGPRYLGHYRHYITRHAYRPWRHAYRPHYRRYYRPYYGDGRDHDDSWYGVHWFFGGH